MKLFSYLFACCLSLQCVGLLSCRLAAQSLEPLEHFKGNRLTELRRTTLEGAKAAASSGAGFEAARLLAALSGFGPPDDISTRAQSLLRDWGLEGSNLTESHESDINRQVRERLQLEHQSSVDLSSIEVLLELESYESAAKTLSRVLGRPIFGNASRQLDLFCQRYVIFVGVGDS